MTDIYPMRNEYMEAARGLLAVCNAFDGVDLPISFDDDPVTGVTTGFTVIEDGQVVGFAALPDDIDPEMCLMVHPERRRRGLGRALLAAVRGETRRRGLGHCLLINDEASASGREFIATEGLPYLSSEYRLELDQSRIERSRVRQDDLVIRPATDDDRHALITILASGFGDPIDHMAVAIDAGLAETKRHYYLAELDGQLIGMIRAGEWDGTGDITSFAVLPEYRGRGFGRQILLEAVDVLVAAGWARILIEVATDNDNALGLYESCGFRMTTRYGFYRVEAGRG